MDKGCCGQGDQQDNEEGLPKSRGKRMPFNLDRRFFARFL